MHTDVRCPKCNRLVAKRVNGNLEVRTRRIVVVVTRGRVECANCDREVERMEQQPPFVLRTLPSKGSSA